MRAAYPLPASHMVPWANTNPSFTFRLGNGFVFAEALDHGVACHRLNKSASAAFWVVRLAIFAVPVHLRDWLTNSCSLVPIFLLLLLEVGAD